MVNRFVFGIAAFFIGVLAHSLFMPYEKSTAFLLYIFIFLSLFIVLIPRKYIITVVILVFGFVGGWLRFDYAIDNNARILDIFATNQVSVDVLGYVNSDPVPSASYYQFVFSVDHLVLPSGEVTPIDTQILVRVDRSVQYRYGQYIRVSGVPVRPEPFETDTGRIFHYDDFLLKDGVYYTMSYTEASLVEPSGTSIQGSLYSLKHHLLDSVYKYIPEPQAGLLAGVLFGQDGALDGRSENNFRRAGLMHIVVLSGYNVSIVIVVFMKIFAFLPRHARASMAMISILGFTLLVGAGPTVVRAAIMGSLLVLSEIVHRPYDIRRALLVAGFFMVLINPYVLYFDLSFQLSFLATYGLLVISPWLENKLSSVPNIFSIRDSLVATLAAQIIVSPLLIYAIGEFSLVSPLVNVLVLWAVPLSMLVGFIVALLGLWVPIITVVPSIIATWFLSYQLWVAEFFARLPFAVVSLPVFSVWVMVVVYILLFIWMRSISKSTDDKREM